LSSVSLRKIVIPPLFARKVEPHCDLRPRVHAVVISDALTYIASEESIRMKQLAIRRSTRNDLSAAIAPAASIN
jgi:hypothetical protein